MSRPLEGEVCPRGMSPEVHAAAHLIHVSQRSRGLYFDVACVTVEAYTQIPDDAKRQAFRSAWSVPFDGTYLLPPDRWF
jgi:hypothetical protein